MIYEFKLDLFVLVAEKNTRDLFFKRRMYVCDKKPERGARGYDR